MRKVLHKRKSQRPRLPQNICKARALLPVRRSGGAWIVDVSLFTPDVPEWGPYDTRAEAEEDRNGIVRSQGADQVLAVIERHRLGVRGQETGVRRRGTDP